MVKTPTVFRTHRTYSGPIKQIFLMASLTVPDESLSIADLLLKHTIQRPIPVFDEDAEIRDPRSYDIAEIEQMRKELTALQLSTNKAAYEEAESSRKAKALAELQATKDKEAAYRQAQRDKLVERQLRES